MPLRSSGVNASAATNACLIPAVAITAPAAAGTNPKAKDDKLSSLPVNEERAISVATPVTKPLARPVPTAFNPDSLLEIFELDGLTCGLDSCFTFTESLPFFEEVSRFGFSFLPAPSNASNNPSRMELPPLDSSDDFSLSLMTLRISSSVLFCSSICLVDKPRTKDVVSKDSAVSA